MAKLVTLQGYLARAETHITEGELRLARQTGHLQNLRDEERDTWQAQILLREIERNLKAWRVHRMGLQRRIARLEAASRL